MTTGSHLRIVSMGTNVQGVRILGDKRHPEHDEFRVVFPGGDLSLTRCTDGTYWAHIRVNHEQDGHEFTSERVTGRLVDARLDITDKHASEVDAGDFENPNLYHVAVRVEVRP